MDNSHKEITTDLRTLHNMPPVVMNLHHPKIANDSTLFGILGCFIVIYSGTYCSYSTLLIEISLVVYY